MIAEPRTPRDRPSVFCRSAGTAQIGTLLVHRRPRGQAFCRGCELRNTPPIRPFRPRDRPPVKIVEDLSGKAPPNLLPVNRGMNCLCPTISMEGQGNANSQDQDRGRGLLGPHSLLVAYRTPVYAREREGDWPGWQTYPNSE
jgi:hypothetical protein